MGVRAKIKTSSPKLLNSWLLFVTGLVIVLAILFYSFVYVKNNEEARIAKGFRVLAQIGENIVKKENDIRNMAENAVKGAKEKSEHGPPSLDDLKVEIENAKRILKMTEKKPGQGNGILGFTTPKVKREKGAAVDYMIYADVDDFFGPLKRPDAFDQLIVLGREHAFDESEKEENGYSVLYHTFPGELDISKLEQLKSAGHGIESGSLKDIEISNKEYKLFLQPVKLKDGRKWYVGGLIDGNKFKEETTALKSGVIIPFLIVFFVFILAIPPLKLFLMSTFEHLDIKDAVLIASSIKFGVVLLVLLYLFVFQVNDDSSDIRNNLGSLANRIKTEFKKELNDAYAQLDKYESDLKEQKLESDDLVKTDILGLEGEKIYPYRYPLFKVVFWMDAAGMQVAQLSTRKHGGSLIDLSHRKYFQDAGNWKLPGKPEESNSKFMLESIISVTSGEKLAAISKRSELELKNGKKSKESGPVKAEVAALTTQLTSLIDTIMPVGYGFCVIDETGVVWFHSNTERNHQENFIQEVGKNGELLSTIYGRQENHIDLDYQSRNHKCFVTPIKDIPLFIITFHDMAYTNSVLTYTFFYTLSFIITLSLFNGLLFVFGAWGNYKGSLLKRKYVPFDWLRPLKKKNYEYQYLTLSNVAIIFFMMILSTFTTGLGTLMLCLLASLAVFAYSYYTINREEKKNPPLVIGPLWERLKSIKRLSRVPALQNYLYFLLSWLVLACVIPVFMFYVDAYNHEHEIARKHLQVKFAEDIEARNFRIEKFYKDKMVKKENQGKEPAPISDTKEKRKISGIYLDIIAHTGTVPGDGKFNTGAAMENTHFNKIAYLLRPSLNRINEEKRNLVFPAASDGSREWQKKNGKLHLQYKIKNSLYNGNGTNSDKGTEEKLTIETDMNDCQLATGFSLPVSVIFVFLVLVLAYFLMRFTVTMIFGLKLIDLFEPLGEFDNQIRKHVDAGSDVIIYCQTGKEMAFCNSLFYRDTEPVGNNVNKKQPIKIDKVIDLNTEDPHLEEIADNGSHQIVFIKNFDLHFNDIDGNLKKIYQVKALLKTQYIQVVIPTFIPLKKMVEYGHEKLTELSDEERKLQSNEKVTDSSIDEVNEQSKKYKQMITLLSEADERWVSLYMPLQTFDRANDKLKTSDIAVSPQINEIEEPHIRKLICKEFKAIEDFDKIAGSVYKRYETLSDKNDPKIEEKLILEIQELATPYYNRLLMSCTNKEKYILHDIAQNMLVNSNNLETQKILGMKGLIVRNGTCRLMNESFRNFILSSVDPEEAESFMTELNVKSKWKSYKAPLILIVLGLVVFLALQDNLVSNVNAILTTVIGGAALLTKLSGFMTNFSKGGGK